MTCNSPSDHVLETPREDMLRAKIAEYLLHIEDAQGTVEEMKTELHSLERERKAHEDASSV